MRPDFAFEQCLREIYAHAFPPNEQSSPLGNAHKPVRQCAAVDAPKPCSTMRMARMGQRYRWHSWFGLRVCIREAVDKADCGIFRCTLSGSGADCRLKVPARMFDRRAMLSTNPFVTVAARSALADLLAEVQKARLASSNALSGASGISRDQNRREVPCKERQRQPGCQPSASRQHSIGGASRSRRIFSEVPKPTA
jgi:hypothetical protein